MAKDLDEFARKRQQIERAGCLLQIVVFTLGLGFTVAVTWVVLHFIIKWW